MKTWLVHSQLMLWPQKQLPVSRFFNLLAVSRTLTMTKNHSQQRQSPQHTLSLRSYLPFASPLLSSPPILSLQMLFGKLSPIHIHSYVSSSSLLHRCCLAHVYPSLSSSFSLSSISPHPHLFTSSLLLHLLFCTRLCLSLHLLSLLIFLPLSTPHSFLHFFNFPPQKPNYSNPPFLSCLSSFFSSLLTPVLPSPPDISPRCFLDRDDLSCSDNETEKCPEAKEVLVVLGWRGHVTVICSQPG